MVRNSVRHRLSLLLAVSTIAGVLMAGILLPFVGGIGLVARSATNDFENLPTDLKEAPLSQVSKIVADNGSTIATFYDQDRTIVPLSQVPTQMQMAIIAIEDVRFYEHNGVDVKGALRALLHNGSSGQVSQGGSTLTQQYVKNVLIEDAHTKSQQLAASADTLSRKVREARYALALEHKLTKQQILERYLNIAYFGDGAYGVGTAAKHYFGEDVSALTLPQAALLAGLVQSPDAYNPRLHPVAAKDRRDTVLAQMLKYHFIDQSAYDAAAASPVTLHINQQSNGCVSSTYGYFCDYVDHVLNSGILPKSVLRAGGLTVTTTLDPKIQAAANAGIGQYVRQHEASKAAAAEAVVQPGTGKVKAIAVSTKYGNNKKQGENSDDYAVDPTYGGSPFGFAAGSTFKLFVLAAALKQGIPLSTTIRSPGSIDVTGYTTCTGNYGSGYTLHNDEPDNGGSYNLKTGTWYSVNTFYAQLEQRTGLCEPVKLAESMGVKAIGVDDHGNPKPGNVSDNIPQRPSFVLGAAAGFSPLDVAGAYATIAAHGKYCQPIVITKITDRSGHSYPVPKADCQQVLDSGLADTITSILQGVLTVHGATGTEDQLTNRPAAAKTGTVDNYDGSWFAGYTPQLAAAVWAGVPSSSQKSLEGLTIGGRYYGGPVFGATLAGRIWQSTMNSALAGQPIVPFSGPSFSYEQGQTSPVPDVSGMSPSDATATLTQAGFSPSVEQGTVHGATKVGTVAYTSPSAGSRANAGSVVRIYISDGTPPPPVTTSPTATPAKGGKTTPPASPSGPPPIPTPPGKHRHHPPH